MPPLQPVPYTEPANHLLTLANQISASLYAGYTGTEHLLMALLLFKQSGAYAILSRAGIGEDDINRKLRNVMVIHEASDARMPSTRPTTEVNRVLSAAMAEAHDLGFPYIASETILLALLGQRDTVAAQVLDKLGLTAERARELVRALHSLPPKQSTAPTAATGQAAAADVVTK